MCQVVGVVNANRRAQAGNLPSHAQALANCQGGLLMLYVYPCVLVAEDDGGFSVFFPDLPEALTCGDDRQSALEMAEDALVVALSGRIDDQLHIPVPSAVLPGQDSVAVPPQLAAKLALYCGMKNQDSPPE